MNPPWWAEAEAEANAIVKDFTAKLEKKLCESPEKIIRRKNPFLFRVRAASNVQTLADMVINAYLSSSEETMFGHVLEDVVIAICKNAKNGRKSGIPNIDLEYDLRRHKDDHADQVWGELGKLQPAQGPSRSVQKRDSGTAARK